MIFEDAGRRRTDRTVEFALLRLAGRGRVLPRITRITRIIKRGKRGSLARRRREEIG